MDPDIRAADRDMREIEQLVQKGVISAGHLPGKWCSIGETIVLTWGLLLD